jgi:citrate lyase beta subunit
MLAKAAELDADEIVVDLEDGVAPADKERARANLRLARTHATRSRCASTAARSPTSTLRPRSPM